MNKIEELILQLCPNGVDYKELIEVCSDFIVPMRDRPQIFDGEIPWCRIEDIQKDQIHGSLLGLKVSKQVISDMNLKVMPKGTVIASCSASLGRYAITTAPLITNQTFIGLVCGDELLNRFLLHLLPLKTPELVASSNSGTIPYISRAKFEKLRIPVPPIKVQKEIVAILDKFIELEDNLEAELEARKTQYQYFCNSLFTFKDGETEELAIKDICRISRGTVISKDYLRDRPGEFPVYSSQTLNNGIFGYIDTFAYDFESLTWTTDGANAGSIFFHQNEKFTITNVCGLLQVLDPSRVSARYLYYVLRTEAPKHVSAGMGNPKLMAGTMGDVKLRIPSMERQLAVVAILDKFDTLLNDISVGLPAEISARKQQYEYYRNRLLTFSELDVA
jgi:type I restriction enzyme S subunit